MFVFLFFMKFSKHIIFVKSKKLFFQPMLIRIFFVKKQNIVNKLAIKTSCNDINQKEPLLYIINYFLQINFFILSAPDEGNILPKLAIILSFTDLSKSSVQ